MMTERKVAGLTPSQTVGPFFAYALTPAAYGLPELATGMMAGEDGPGQRITVTGRVFDGAGAPVTDAMLEIWQADSTGTYARPGANAAFNGFGRTETDAEGRFTFTTLKPGRVTDSQAGQQAPHLSVSLFARGLMIRLATRIYFGDEPANATDPVLALVPAARRQTLLAAPNGATYTLDIHLQGENETVFFDV
jgi:protocatechuate 3,4-dioxygenase, alpha subunit